MSDTSSSSCAKVDIEAIARAASDLESQGWAVVPDVLTPPECKQYVDEAWLWLASLDTGINRNDPASWGDDKWPSSFRGIINTLEVSHQDFVWRIRQHPSVLKVAYTCNSPLLNHTPCSSDTTSCIPVASLQFTNAISLQDQRLQPSAGV